MLVLRLFNTLPTNLFVMNQYTGKPGQNESASKPICPILFCPWSLNYTLSNALSLTNHSKKAGVDKSAFQAIFLSPVPEWEFKSWSVFKYGGFSMWHFLRLVVGGFLLITHFPYHCHHYHGCYRCSCYNHHCHHHNHYQHNHHHHHYHRNHHHHFIDSILVRGDTADSSQSSCWWSTLTQTLRANAHITHIHHTWHKTILNTYFIRSHQHNSLP